MEKNFEELKLSQKLNGYLLQKLGLLQQGSSPFRDCQLQLTKLLISMTEREFKSFNKPTATNQLQKSEEQLVNGVTDVADREEEDEFEMILPSYLFEEDDSIDLELIPSYFFDEEEAADTVDSEVLIPLFFSDEGEELPDGVDVKQVLNNEVNCKKLMSLQVTKNNNLNRLICEGFYIIINYSRILFDRGREIGITRGFSDVGNYKYCTISNKPGSLLPSVCSIQVDKFDWKSVYGNVPKHGFTTERLFEDSMVFLLFKNETRHDAGNMFDKTPESVVWWLHSGRDDFLLQYKMGKLSYNLLVDECLYLIFGSSRGIFDRGKAFKLLVRYSYFNGDYELCLDRSSVIVLHGLVLLNLFNENCVCELIPMPGYPPVFQFMNSLVLMCINGADISGNRKLVLQMSDGNSISILLFILVCEIERVHGFFGAMTDCVLRDLIGSNCLYLYFASNCSLFDPGKDIPCIELFRVLIKGQEGVVLQIHMMEFIFLLLLHFPVSTWVSFHSYLWNTVSCQHSPFLRCEAIERLVVLEEVLHHYQNCVYRPYPDQHLNSGCNRLLGMYDFDFSLCLIPCCICMWRRVYHTWKVYSWTKISIRKLGTHVVLIVNQQLDVVRLLVSLSWKYKLLTSENYESLVIREEEAQLHFDYVKFILQSPSYTQHDSNFCLGMWILTSVVCFFNYFCYPYSVFDRGKRLANSDLRYDNGSLVSELDLRLGYSSEFQFRFPIVFLLVNYGGSGDGYRLFLEISYIYMGTESIFTFQWTKVMSFSKAHNFLGQVHDKKGAQIFSLHSGFLNLKGVSMTVPYLSNLLMGVFNSDRQYVGLDDVPLLGNTLCCNQWLSLTRQLGRGYVWLELQGWLTRQLLMLAVIRIPNVMLLEISSKLGFTKNGDAQHICFHCNQLWGLEYQPVRGHSYLKLYGRRIGLQFVSTLIYILVVLMSEVPFPWEFSLFHMGLLSGGTVKWMCLHCSFKLKQHLTWLVSVLPDNSCNHGMVNKKPLWLIQANMLITTETTYARVCSAASLVNNKTDHFHLREVNYIQLQICGTKKRRIMVLLVTTNEAATGLCATVVNYNHISHTLQKACRYLPCCNQMLGFLLRHKWRSKGVLFFETEVETTSTSTRVVGEVLDDYFQLQQYILSSHTHTSTTKSTTNSRDSQANVGGGTCLQLQPNMQIRRADDEPSTCTHKRHFSPLDQ